MTTESTITEAEDLLHTGITELITESEVSKIDEIEASTIATLPELQTDVSVTVAGFVTDAPKPVSTTESGMIHFTEHPDITTAEVSEVHVTEKIEETPKDFTEKEDPEATTEPLLSVVADKDESFTETYTDIAMISTEEPAEEDETSTTTELSFASTTGSPDLTTDFIPSVVVTTVKSKPSTDNFTDTISKIDTTESEVFTETSEPPAMTEKPVGVEPGTSEKSSTESASEEITTDSIPKIDRVITTEFPSLSEVEEKQYTTVQYVTEMVEKTTEKHETETGVVLESSTAEISSIGVTELLPVSETEKSTVLMESQTTTRPVTSEQFSTELPADKVIPQNTSSTESTIGSTPSVTDSPIADGTESPFKIEFETSAPHEEKDSKACKINGTVYHDGAEVENLNKCQHSCKCLNGTVSCRREACPQTPSKLLRCSPIPVYTDDECCPIYKCRKY